ncbi:MAG: entericidin A/B family lipoprotein [Alphaproteobacteria bacterium]
MTPAIKKLVVAIGAAAFAAATLAACNTVEGVGKDLQTVGGAISKKADEKK